MAATTEAASPICRVRKVSSLKSARPSPRAAATAGGLVVEIAVLGDQGGGDGAIEEAGVEMGQAVVRSYSARDGALARGRGPVDGDDHPKAAASPRLSNSERRS